MREIDGVASALRAVLVLMVVDRVEVGTADTHSCGATAMETVAKVDEVDEDEEVFFTKLERRMAVPGPSAKAPS